VPDSQRFYETLLREIKAKSKKTDLSDTVIIGQKDNQILDSSLVLFRSNGYKIKNIVVNQKNIKDLRSSIAKNVPESKVVVFFAEELNKVATEFPDEKLYYGIEVDTSFIKTSSIIKKRITIDHRIGMLEFLKSNEYKIFIESKNISPRIYNYSYRNSRAFKVNSHINISFDTEKFLKSIDNKKSKDGKGNKQSKIDKKNIKPVKTDSINQKNIEVKKKKRSNAISDRIKITNKDESSDIEPETMEIEVE